MELNIDEAIAKCQKGDLEQFGLLFDSFHEKIYRFVYFRTQHKQTAEDITGAVFFKALENIGSYKPAKAAFQTWLYQIAKNSIIDFYRTRKETNNIEDAFDVSTGSSIEFDLDTRQRLEKVQKYLQRLPKLQRDIVIMRVWDGLSHSEIAQILGITEANSKVTFSRVLAKLNKEAVFTLLSLLIIKNL